MRERRLRLEFAFARRLDFLRERCETLFERRNRRPKRFALGLHASGVFVRLRGLRFERFAARERGGIVRFDTREFGAFALRLRPDLFELQFLLIGEREALFFGRWFPVLRRIRRSRIRTRWPRSLPVALPAVASRRTSGWT